MKRFFITILMFTLITVIYAEQDVQLTPEMELHLALKMDNMEMAKKVIKRGVDFGKLSLSSNVILSIVWSGDKEMLKLALQSHNVKPHLDVAPSGGGGGLHGTALTYAVFNNEYEMAKILLEAGADVNAKPYVSCYRPLSMINLSEHSYRFLELLLSYDADPNLVDGKGILIELFRDYKRYDEEKRLDYKEKFLQMVRALCDNGAEVIYAVNGNYSAVTLANDIGDDDIIKVIKRYLPGEGELNRIMFKAAKENNMIELKKALLHGADTNSKDEEGRTALIYAIHNNSEDMVHYIIWGEYKPNLETICNGYYSPDGTALLQAVATKRLEIAFKLLDCGAKANVEEPETGNTPIFYLKYYQKYNRERLLSSLYYSRVRINHQNKEGNTILMEMAKSNSYNHIVRLLLEEYDADKSVVNNAGETALSIAERFGADKNYSTIRWHY